jgi:hypothetical protein
LPSIATQPGISIHPDDQHAFTAGGGEPPLPNIVVALKKLAAH